MSPRYRDRDDYDDFDDRELDEELSPSVSKRIQTIIDAAEKAAAGILNDAKREAKRQIDDSNRRAEQMAKDRIRNIYELTDGLVERARNVKDQSDTLLGALDNAIKDVRDADPEAMREVERARFRTREPRRRRRAPEPDEYYDEELEPDEEESIAARDVELEDEPELERPAPPRRRRRRKRARRRAAVKREPESDVDDSTLEEARLEATRMAVSGASRRQIRKRLNDDYDLEDSDELIDEILGSD